MKHRTASISWILICALLLSLLPAAALGEAQVKSFLGSFPFTIQKEEVWGIANESGEAESFVRYPVFTTDDVTLAPVMEKINQAIQEKAEIPAYLQLLSTLQPGGTGLRMDYDMGSMASSDGIQGRVLSLLFTAEGKMLRGRPSQVYYPMTFDLLTGEEITFEQLFTDPDGAKAWIEAYLEEEVEPTLSTYLENNQLFPVPYDRFFLDSFGHVILVYENSQLSFLSGTSGAVSFRYSELKDYLDFSDDSVVAHLPWIGYSACMTKEERAESAWSYLRCCALIPGNPLVTVGERMETVLNGYPHAAFRLHAAADSDYYPGGAYFELEEAVYRGTLILTDADETKVTGLLTDSLDLYDLETGRTPLTDAESFLGKEPDAHITIDADIAEIYHVCPGTASVYRLEAYGGTPLALTLYADENGILQYMKLALDNQ